MRYFSRQNLSHKKFSSVTRVLVLAPFCLALHAQVLITLKTDRVSVDVNGRPFTDLYMGQQARKPFLYPLRAASGKKVSRGFPVQPDPGDPTDHPHQKGLWVGAERLNVAGSGQMDLWENDPSYDRPHMGDIRFKDVLSKNNGANEGSFSFIADWLSPQNIAVITETRSMTFYSEPADCRMFDVDLHLHALKDLFFEDHHDAVIGIRLAPAFSESHGGRPVNAQGLQGEANVRGRKSEWIDWQTNLGGEALGVALMDHPGNFSFPTRWHVRAMGLLVASPFAQRDYSPDSPSGAKFLAAGEELHFRYRIIIHPQSTDVNAIYQEFAAR